MKIKAANLIGDTLDWAVELALGTHWSPNGYFVFKSADGKIILVGKRPANKYSSDWLKSGPIVDRIEGLQIKSWLESKPDSKCEAHIHNYEGNWVAFGPTLLVAIMRVFVMSKLGDEVEVPDELVKE